MACKKSRDHPEAAAAIAGQLTDTLTLPMRRLDVAPIGALALALVWGLSVNDATYSWLAAASAADVRSAAGGRSGRDGPVLLRPRGVCYGTFRRTSERE